MSNDDVNANVVLTADNSQYDRSMQQSAQQTDAVSASLSKLGDQLKATTASAGRKLIGISAADVATITGATFAYAAYEKQMTSLNTQAASLSSTMRAQNQTFANYQKDVASLRTGFGMSTADAAQLERTLTRLSDRTTSVRELGKTFAMFGEATQENVVGLSSSLLQLQKTMGTPQRDTEKYANQLTVLSNRANTSAQSIAEFTQQIAPVGRLANISQTDLQGFSTSFIKAGQDGYQAANVFNKMLTDITYATQSGSPDLAKYANLVGMTTANFKELSGTDKYLKIFEAINQQGPKAITTLNRLGLDGARTVRTVSAMAQNGGMEAEIAAARGADPGAMKRASDTGMEGIVDSLKRFRSEMAQSAEAVGSVWAGPAKAVVDAMTSMAGSIKMVAESPIGKLGSLFAGALAPLTAFAGVAGTLAGPLSMFAGLQMIRGSAVARGLGDGRERTVSQRGAEYRNTGSWTTRGLYNLGQRAGSFLPERVAGQPGLISRGLGYAGMAAGGSLRMYSDMILSPGAMRMPFVRNTGGFDNANARFRLFNAPTVGQSFRNGMMMFQPGGIDRLRDLSSENTARREAAASYRDRGIGRTRGVLGGLRDNARSLFTSQGREELRSQGEAYGGRLSVLAAQRGFAQSAATQEAQERAAARAAASLDRVAASGVNAESGFKAFLKGAGAYGGMLTGVGAGATRTAGGIVTRTGASLARSVGGVVAGPMGVILGASMGYSAVKAAQDGSAGEIQDLSGFGRSYYEAAGIQGPASAAAQYRSTINGPVNMSDAMTVDDRDRLVADNADYRGNKDLKGLTAKQALARIQTQWSSYSKSPQLINKLALDLTAQYGQSTAQQILNQARAGQGNLDSFSDLGEVNKLSLFSKEGIGQVLSHPLADWDENNKVDRYSGKQTTEQFNQLFAGMRDQFSQTAQDKGYDAANKERGQLLEQNVKEYLAKGNKKDGTQIAAEQSILKEVLGIDPKDTNYKNGLFDRSGTSQVIGDSKDLKDILIRVNTKGQAAGDSKQANRNRIMGLSTLGLDTTLRGKAAGLAEYQALTNPTALAPEDANSARSQIQNLSGGTYGSGGALQMKSVAKALDTPGDINAQYKAVQDLTTATRKAGGTIGDQLKKLNDMAAATGGDTNLGYELFKGASARTQQALQYQAPNMSRTDLFAAQTSQFKGLITSNLDPNGGSAQREQVTQQYAAQMQSQTDFFRQQLYQQREYNVSRQRAEEDFGRSRAYADQDFNLSRNRAFFDFHLSRSRAEDDYARQRERNEENFQRSMNRNKDDFMRSRQRQEEDHNHQVMLMVEQQAKQMYNVYQRVNVQRTSSAGWLLSNSQDQLKRMQEQSGNLSQVRKMGLSDNAIQQMGFNDSANAQQLGRFVTEATNNPKLIKEFNDTVAKRLSAAKKLVTDESSQEWQEFQRSYKLARSRAQDDFELSAKRARQDYKRSLRQQNEDFKRSLREQEADFQRSMGRQADDYNTSMDRQAAAYKLSMDRSAADLERAATTIDGNFEQILKKATEGLSGHAKQQAKTVLKEFKDLKSSTDPAAEAIMESLSDIFGVDYKPKKAKQTGASVRNDAFTSKRKQNFAAGGTTDVTPGYTPGVDVHHYSSPTGGDIALSGGEGIMVPEWVQQMGGPGAIQEMNRRARAAKSVKQRFAKGGVVWPTSGHITSTYAGHDGVDINGRGQDYGNPIYAFRDGTITYAGSGHGYGNAIFEKVAGGPTVVYGHGSQVFVKAGQHVDAGQVIGRVGSTGNSSGPHLHFGIPGGTYAQAMALLRGATGIKGGPNFGSGSGMTLADIIKDAYPKVEKSVDAMTAINPFGKNMMSAIINRFARAAFAKMKKEHPGYAEQGLSGSVPSFSHANMGNQQIVHTMANKMGWGSMWGDLYKLVMSESGFRNTAQNPTSSAYGMFQFLDSTWKGYGGKKTSDPYKQSQYGLRYIKERYGNPSKAWDFHQAHNWYGDGAIIASGSKTIGVGDRGPEMVLPLNDKGVSFLTDLMVRTGVGVEGKRDHLGSAVPRSIGGGSTTHTYQIDRSTTFTGPIQVQAQNPQDLIRQLEQRKATAALTNPVLGGR